ncbi:MAG: TadG family pilus assembly protein [Chlorobiaceae bacterium]
MVTSHHSIKPLNSQRGGAAILFALCLPVLLGFAALAVDLARLNLTKVELQNAADAAAVAGARSLSSTNSLLSTDKPYNWTAAADTARYVVQRNFANARRIQDAQIETGYWNLNDPSLGLYHPGTPGAGDVPAVRVTVAISSTQNSGPFPFFFGPILGIAQSNVHASAIAMIAPSGGGTGLFPFVVQKSIFNPAWWDEITRSPKINPQTGKPYSIQVNLDSFYPTGGVGTWTSLTTASNADSYVSGLISGVNSSANPVAIGDNIWIANGTMTNLYGKINSLIGKDVAIPVVNAMNPGSWQQIVAIAGFHIDSSTKQGNKSYITGHFISNADFGTTNPGSGNGLPLGAYTPPILVE